MRTKLSAHVLENATPRVTRYLLRDTRTLGLALKVEPSGTRTFVFEYRLAGQKSQRYNIGRYGAPWTLEQARREAGRLRGLVDQGIDPVGQRRTTVEVALTECSLADLAQRFLLHLEVRQRRPSTLREYRRILESFVLPRLGRLPVGEISTSHLEHLHSELKATPYQANRMLAVLSRAFNLAERWGWRQPGTNPVRHIERFREARRGAKKGAMLSPGQIARFLEVLHEEGRSGADPFAVAAIQFAFWTGWRMVSEVLRLRWVDVDLDTGQARLLKTKTAEEEYRSLPDEAIEILSCLPRIAGYPWVFPGQDAERPRTTVRRQWDRIRDKAGLSDLEDLGAFRIHDLRHNAVSWDVSRGVSLKVAGANVGHRSVRSTEVYSHFAPDHLRAAANARSRAMRDAAAAAKESPTQPRSTRGSLGTPTERPVGRGAAP